MALDPLPSFTDQQKLVCKKCLKTQIYLHARDKHAFIWRRLKRMSRRAILNGSLRANRRFVTKIHSLSFACNEDFTSSVIPFHNTQSAVFVKISTLEPFFRYKFLCFRLSTTHLRVPATPSTNSKRS